MNIPRTETEIQRAILNYLIARGFLAHLQKGLSLPGRKGLPWTHGGTNGVSDIAAIMPGGRSLRIEVKCPGAKKQRHEPLQDEYLARARALGAVAFKAESLDDVIRQLLPVGSSPALVEGSLLRRTL